MSNPIPADIDLALLANYPAMLPPEGVTPNFVDPYTLGPIFVIVSSVLITIMMIFVVVRIYTRIFINRKLYWDDCQSSIEAHLLVAC